VVFRAPPRSRVSQWHEEHEYLIAVVAWAKTERSGPTASHSPPEPGIDVLQPGPAADGEAKLLQAHLSSRDLPGVHHQGTSDPLPRAEGRLWSGCCSFRFSVGVGSATRRWSLGSAKLIARQTPNASP
jgi:hypothetical protein